MKTTKRQEFTDEQMRKKLESLGYDFTDENGEFDLKSMIEVASVIKNYKWDEKKEVWYI